MRTAVVRELLWRYAPTFAASAQQRAFLVDRLKLPPAWVAEALAAWARAGFDTAGELLPCFFAESCESALAALRILLHKHSVHT